MVDKLNQEDHKVVHCSHEKDDEEYNVVVLEDPEEHVGVRNEGSILKVRIKANLYPQQDQESHSNVDEGSVVGVATE
eukprot:CAMPEP_0170566118 /NCGR_PEP_ID=MMETSP0211-20121228/79627_1 /TAXON_ID=311385 /ORGANISM="Pseudokeronopsis sp., Strain OXSARD2" /LENGTH=76 /DNA_ID=CAMNT_0010887199 /DNA_START=2431 /DNA_END=2661 /DNA_ORIENTATION=-